MNQLAQIQSEIKAPKGQYNSFGKYKYRSCEDIVEAVKPVLVKHGFFLNLTDEVQMIGNRYYIKATATISNGEQTFTAIGWAREEEVKKGMDSSQVTGASSSYARKYALNGLFAIDDTKDSDATNTHDREDEITDKERDELHALLNSSTYDQRQRDGLFNKINGFTTFEQYNTAKANLLANQAGIDAVINPSQKDIKNHIKRVASA